jgi:nucleoside-diphosphate-sugar epimerase
MRLFVTGATGFIGSHFVRLALASGHDVVALRRSKGSAPRVALDGAPRWLDKAMGAVEAEDFQAVDALVHLAAVGVSPQRASWDEMFAVNVLESLHVWQTAADAGVRRFVVCGSCYEYGRTADRAPWLTPEAPLEPVGGYAASKAAASMAAMALAIERNLELVIARPFHVYGDGQHEENFWPALRRAALAGQDFSMTAGEQVRDFTAVNEVAAALLDSSTREDIVAGAPRVVHIGSGKPQTLRQFAENWWSHWKATGALRVGALPYRAGEVMRCVPALEGRAAA